MRLTNEGRAVHTVLSVLPRHCCWSTCLQVSLEKGLIFIGSTYLLLATIDLVCVGFAGKQLQVETNLGSVVTIVFFTTESLVKLCLGALAFYGVLLKRDQVILNAVYLHATLLGSIVMSVFLVLVASSYVSRLKNVVELQQLEDDDIVLLFTICLLLRTLTLLYMPVTYLHIYSYYRQLRQSVANITNQF